MEIEGLMETTEKNLSIYYCCIFPFPSESLDRHHQSLYLFQIWVPELST